MRATTDLADILALHVRAIRLPEAVREFKPFPDRRFRIDLAWPDRLMAVECDGGEWTVGRHSRGTGMQSDNEKCNRLTLEGWSVFRVTGAQVRSGYAVALIERALRLC